MAARRRRWRRAARDRPGPFFVGFVQTMKSTTPGARLSLPRRGRAVARSPPFRSKRARCARAQPPRKTTTRAIIPRARDTRRQTQRVSAPCGRARARPPRETTRGMPRRVLHFPRHDRHDEEKRDSLSLRDDWSGEPPAPPRPSQTARPIDLSAGVIYLGQGPHTHHRRPRRRRNDDADEYAPSRGAARCA